MAKIKKGDFVELNYTGRVAGEEKVFDTTIKKVAQKNGILQPQAPYQPIKIVVGEGHVIEGLDDAIEGNEISSFKVKVNSDKAFGSKNSKLLKMIPAREFKKQNVKPFVGLEVNIDGMPGIVRSASSGRIIVDFNHPLASKDLEYEVELKRVIDNPKEKVEAVLDLMGMPHSGVEVTDKKAEVRLNQKIPTQFHEQAQKEAKRLAGVDLEFKEKTEPEEKKKQVSE